MTIAVEPLKSQGDKRSYRVISLANGLECVLVSDIATDKAAAALDVRVGSWSDPAHLPGLAHFLEVCSRFSRCVVLFLFLDPFLYFSRRRSFVSFS